MSARDLLQRASGLDLDQATVDRALRERMLRCGIADPGAYLRRISAGELEALIELVVVPESWMLRDPDAFGAAADFVQRRLARDPERPVRILCLPCAGGEEPYSMAIALHDAGVAPAAYRIEGVDLSARAIDRARAGRYTRNAFRGQQLAFRDRYFTACDGEYQIDDALRAQVSFSQGNLLSFDIEANARRYDVVFCRNLLIYFDEPTAAAASARLHAVLADDGMLFAGYAEVPAFCRHGFVALRTPGAFALHKETAAPAAPERRARRMPARPAPAAPQPPPAAPEIDVAGLLAQARRQADHADYQAAAASCHAALAAEPESADAYFILGMLSECERKPALAHDYWRRCVYLQPDHYEALCHLALLLGQAGDDVQAGVFRQRAARLYQRGQDRTKSDIP